MVRLTPGNPAINEKYFEQQGMAKNITKALLEEYDIGWSLPNDGFEDDGFAAAHESQIEATIQKVIDENL